MKITKLKLLKKEVSKSQAKQPDNIKPTETFHKRRVTTGGNLGHFEVIDERHTNFLDPGAIKITTRLRSQLNQSIQNRNETPTNITKINKMINLQAYKRQKKF